MLEPKSILGLGTAAIGRPEYINVRQDEVSELSLEAFRQKGMELLNDAYDQGLRYFDTAPGYGFAEQLLIDWISEKNDSKIEIATKWGYTYVADFKTNVVEHELKEHSLNKLKEQWKLSKRLLPQLTTYQIHSATFETGVLDNVKILEHLAKLKEEHKLRIGITTTGADQVEVIKKALDVQVRGIPIFDVFQVTYNVFDQSLGSIAHQLLKGNKRIVIKEALANGRIFPNSHFSHYSKIYNKMSEMAIKYNVGLDAIALRFCIDSFDVYKVLSGAILRSQLEENLKTVEFEMLNEDIQILKEMAVDPLDYWKERKLLKWN